MNVYGHLDEHIHEHPHGHLDEHLHGHLHGHQVISSYIFVNSPGT